MRVLMTGMMAGLLVLGGCTSTGSGAAAAAGVYVACGTFAGSLVTAPFV